MFARSLSIHLRKPLGDTRAIDYVREAPEELKGCLRYSWTEALRTSLRAMEDRADEILALHEILSRLPRSEEPSAQALEEAREVFDAMAPFRARATQALLGASGDAKV
jgi:hypothetical protein